MSRIKNFVLSGVVFFIFIGCAAKIEHKIAISEANLQKQAWENLQGFETDNHAKALEVFKKDCTLSQKDLRLQEVCKIANTQESFLDPKEFFQNNFTPYQLLSEEEEKEGLITGYYEPLLYGSYHKTKRFQYPVYAVPSNLLKIDLKQTYPSLGRYTLRGKLHNKSVVPYETREEIENIDYRTTTYLKPICFVDDKIELFFLHIQGSGKVQLPNGKYINIGYGAQNGHPYYSIGKELLQMGALKKEEISLQTIKKWLLEHPSKIDPILNSNPSYIFFHQSAKTATGSLGTQLVAKRNIAVDTRNIPLGFPVYIHTTNPLTKEPFNKLMVAADTGGAIKGKIRADLFFGDGIEARTLAGNMKQSGELFLLIPNTKKIITNKE